MEVNDLKIIQHLYFKDAKSVIVFDPNRQLKGECPRGYHLLNSNNDITELLCKNRQQKYIVFNLSEKKNWFDIHEDKVENIIYFNQNNSSNSGIKHYFINNPNGAMRWIFPSSNLSPIFLSLYNNTGWKAQVYKLLVKGITLLGREQLFSQGYFTFEKMTASMFEFLPNQYHDDYAIFTGTAGANRKAIVAIGANKHVNSFVKIPLTDKAKTLVQSELQQLNYIRQFDFDKMITPKCSGTSSNLVLSNIKPSNTIKQVELTDQHLQAIAEYYNKSTQKVSPESIEAWNEIQSNLNILNNDFEIKNNLDNAKISRIISKLNQLSDWIIAKNEIPVGLAHGDFTPWNMYLTKEKIHVYDWEMSKRDMPILFDVFHYIFQSNILIKQNNYKSIEKELDTLQQNEIVRKIVSENAVDWSIHYAFYLVYISSYYLPLYMTQQDLHMQAHWLVDVWDDALESVLIPEVQEEYQTIHNNKKASLIH